MKSIGFCAFDGCASLTNITIPDSIISIGGYAFDNTAYYNDINNWEDNILYIGNHLIRANTRAPHNFTVKDGTLTIADFAFRDCTNLTTVTLPDSVTAIGEEAFYECKNLTNITLPNGITSIGRAAFAWCKSLTNISIPNCVLEICDDTFLYCTNLTDITIPDSVTLIADSAFYECRSLVNITIPESVTRIEKHAFSGCTNLQNITLPGEIASIERYVFAQCSNLKEVTLPCTVKSIEYHAFDGCENLTDVYYNGTKEQWGNIKINLGNESLLNATLHFNDSDDIAFTFSIQTPSATTIRHNDGIVLHADIEGELPDGCTVAWSMSNKNFKATQSADGTSLEIISQNKGYTTFTVHIFDVNGYILAEDSIEMYSQAGIFDKIAGFFRSLFGLDKILSF